MGVPQGSKLGPLYLIFCNNFDKYIDTPSLLQYVNDISITITDLNTN